MADQRRLSPNVTAALVLALVAAALLLWQRPWQGAPERDVDIPANASALLTQQFRELSEAGSESEFADVAGSTDAAITFASNAWSAREALGVRDVGLRYVTGGDIADRADGSTQADVEVSWMAGSASGLTEVLRTSTVRVRLDPQADGTFAIRAVSAGSGPLPIWLAGKVEVLDQGDSVVITVDGGDASQPIADLTSQAHATVVDALPDVTGKVVVVSPRTEGKMAELIGGEVTDISQIAAVTTDLRGSNGTGDGSVILLNPAVFSTMDQRAAQVVLSHEAAHLLTSALGTSAATWVVEGFADFVALRDDDAPLALSAGQVLAGVNAGNTPTRLPGPEEFAATGRGFGAAYEAAWMVFRMLGESYSEATIKGFYRAALDGAKLGDALNDAFGLTIKQLTADWQRYLEKSASTVS